MPSYSFKIINFAGISDILISSTGYTGSGGLRYTEIKTNEESMDSF